MTYQVKYWRQWQFWRQQVTNGRAWTWVFVLFKRTYTFTYTVGNTFTYTVAYTFTYIFIYTFTYDRCQRVCVGNFSTWISNELCGWWLPTNSFSYIKRREDKSYCQIAWKLYRRTFQNSHMYVCMNVYAAYMSDVYPKTEREVSDKDLSVLVSLTLSPFDNASVVYFSFSAL